MSVALPPRNRPKGSSAAVVRGPSRELRAPFLGPVVGVLVLAVVTAGIVIHWTAFLRAPVHSISSQSFNCIKMGMTSEEVEAILGVPPGDYSRTLDTDTPWAEAS